MKNSTSLYIMAFLLMGVCVLGFELSLSIDTIWIGAVIVFCSSYIVEEIEKLSDKKSTPLLSEMEQNILNELTGKK